MKDNLSEYELQVVRDIARHIVEPNALHQTLKYLGKPIEKVFDLAEKSRIKALKKTSEIVQNKIREVIMSTILLSSRAGLFKEKNVIRQYGRNDIKIASIDDIRLRNMPLANMDKVADSYDISNALILGVEGFMMGGAATIAEAVPLAQIMVPVIIAADVSASMTFLARHVSLVAASYGYSARDPGNIPHLLAAMVPMEESFDEGYLGAKITASEYVQDAGAFLIQFGGRRITPEALEKEAPYLLRLIVLVADRLGVVLTEKALATIIFLAGAALNSAINVAFQQVGHTAAKDYFRRMTLENKYGRDAVREAIEKEVHSLKND